MKTQNILELAGRYGIPAIALHWTLALLIPIQIGLGWYMLSIEKQPGSAWYFALHISLGLTAALLIGLRFAWRLGHGAAPLPETVATWQRKVVRGSHALLYLAMIVMPLTGYLGASFSGDAIGYFGISLPNWARGNDLLKEQFFAVHSFVAWLLVVLIGIHVLGALKHLVIDKDGVFWRMWPH